jgi:malate dehydrogenase (oxaloacetate-decarboxylating)
MNIKEKALLLHEEWQGKIEIICRCPVESAADLTVAYTPGVAEPCLKIATDPSLSYKYTRRWNTVAVITDGTAVLGLGDIGPEASMPVMEGKCVLFKSFAGVDALPLCIRSKDVDEIVRTVELLCGSFGGINLEDIAAPRCFEIERRLKQVCDIPIFHDDQHGTAVVTVAALSNALKIVGKEPQDIRIAISGAGASGMAVALLLMRFGVKDIALCDSKGAIYAGRQNLDADRAELAKITNLHLIKGGLSDIMKDADVFIGLSAAGLVTADMVRSMAKNPIVFAMANPTPEIMPDEALAAGAAIVGTGRSDFANQINNVLAFPGIMRGALDVRASDINEEMKLAAALAIANFVKEDELKPERILPAAFEAGVGEVVAQAVAQAANLSGVARI